MNEYRTEEVEDPREFLKYSEEEWRTMNVECNKRANRWRLSRFRDAFRDAGLEEASLERNYFYKYPPLTQELVDSFHPDFKKLDRIDLETVDCIIVNRKPI